MRSILTTIVIMFSFSSNAQDCGVSFMNITRTDEHGVYGNMNMQYLLASNYQLNLSGSFEIKDGDTCISEFVLFDCRRQENIVELDGTGGGTIVEMSNDTLVLKHEESLPIGDNFSLKWVPFHIQKYYYYRNEVRSIARYDNSLKKYSKREIGAVLNNYQKLKKDNFDELLKTANMLFWAFVSGSNEAADYLNTFEEKFGPFDGAISEEWSDINMTFLAYKEKL